MPAGAHWRHESEYKRGEEEEEEEEQESLLTAMKNFQLMCQIIH